MAGKTSAEVLLDQIVRYSTTQWDSAGRLSTRAGGIVSLAGSALVAGIALLLGSSFWSIACRLSGFLTLGVAVFLAGHIVISVGWDMPPDLDSSNLATAMGFSGLAVQQALVLEYAGTCDENDKWLAKTGFRVNVAIVLTVLGIIMFAASYALGKAGI